MKTVKEVSELTGISVRTLHYYDEIGLFKPTEVTEAGYRLYDDKAIEKLGQILVFRELDLPLADIKLIMDNPDLDRNSVLAKQREMLCLKKCMLSNQPFRASSTPWRFRRLDSRKLPAMYLEKPTPEIRVKKRLPAFPRSSQ